MKVLLLNAGSSSLKASVLEAEDASVVASGQVDWKDSAARFEFVGPDGRARRCESEGADYASAVRWVLAEWTASFPGVLASEPTLAAVGHRVVHGGPFTSSVLITPEVRSQIAELAELAPLHNPPCLETLAAAESVLPGLPHIAVFDTAYHATLSPEAYTYPVPHAWASEWGIRRYGFHGLSHAYAARRAVELLGRDDSNLRLVICHLGHGCSATAVLGGRSVDTTMGFTPLDGLMMATRCGALDPGVLLYLQRRHGIDPASLESILNRESGLLGVSGLSSDLRRVLEAARGGDQRAGLAVAVYTRRVKQAIGSLVATLGGIDGLVFTAGVGEHSAEIRASVLRGLDCLGLHLDPDANLACRPDADIALPTSAARVLVIHAREDLTMLAELLAVTAREFERTNQSQQESLWSDEQD